MLTRANRLDSRSPTYRNGRGRAGAEMLEAAGRHNCAGRHVRAPRAGGRGKVQNRESGKTDRQFGGSDSESVSGEGYDEATATKQLNLHRSTSHISTET